MSVVVKWSKTHLRCHLDKLRMRMCFQTTNIDFKHRPFIVSKICTQSLPPRSPMRILQYVGQVWHAVVSWSDFPLQGMSQTRTECNRTGQASCCVFTYKGRLKIRKQPAQKDYPEYLSTLFCVEFFA